MSCDNNKNRKAQNKDAVNKAKASLDEATSALAEATKQEKDTEKKHADAEAGFIMFIVSSAASGIVSKCRIPTAAVAQRGLFRLLLGSDVSTSDVITDIVPKLYGGNFDPDYTGDVICDVNRGDASVVHRGNTWGSYGEGSGWPTYTSSFSPSYDPFSNGTTFGDTSVTVDSAQG